MSTENRSKTPVFIGFGALVAIVIVAIALWPTNFRKEDASGAIGAVQKHRAPQITSKDVILGDESFKHQQKVLYADFVADSQKLQAIAASKNMAGSVMELNALSSELQHRFFNEAQAASREAEAASRGLEARTGQAGAMMKENIYLKDSEAASRAYIKESELASRAYLKESDVAAARVTLQSDVDTLNALLAKGALSDSDREQFNGKLGLIVVICSKTMSRAEQAERELASIGSRIEKAKLDSEFQAAARELKDVQGLLARPLYDISLADRAKYLDATQRELKAIGDATEAYAAKRLNDQELSGRVLQVSEQMSARATENIKASSELMSELAHRLADMNEAMARFSRFELGKMELGRAELGRAELGRAIAGAKAELKARDSEFYARATAASEEQAAFAKTVNDQDLATRLANLQTSLQSRQNP